MGVAERRQREREEVRARILDAAGELFIREGFENTSIRRIADKIEYAPSTIYLYFKDKDDLLATICQEMFEKLTVRLEKLIQKDLPPLELIRQGLKLYIEFGLAHPSHYLVTFNVHALVHASGHEMADKPAAGLRGFEILAQGLQKGMEDGSIRRQDVRVLAQSVWMMAHGVTNMLITSTDMPGFTWAPKKTLIEKSLDLIVRAIQA
jgi:AcrR family transcriptional regulator